jgi:hypothetical protein
VAPIVNTINAYRVVVGKPESENLEEIGVYGWTEIQCVRKVAVHLHNVLEVMFTRVYTGMNPN